MLGYHALGGKALGPFPVWDVWMMWSYLQAGVKPMGWILLVLLGIVGLIFSEAEKQKERELSE